MPSMEGHQLSSPESKDAEVRSALETIHDTYKKHPFTKQMVMALSIVAGIFASSKVQGAEVEDVAALLSAVEFIEQAEEMKEHPEVVEAARTLYEYHANMSEEDMSATWQGSMLNQQMYGAGEFVNFENRMQEFPHQGSGVLHVESRLQEALSRTGDESVIYTGYSRHFKVLKAENMEYSKDLGTTLTITVEVSKDGDVNEGLVEAIAGEAAYRTGVEVSTERGVNRSDTNTDLSESHVLAIDSRSSAPIAWSVQGSERGEDGVTRYTVTLQFGEVMEAE
jgi:hypothetical protein